MLSDSETSAAKCTTLHIELYIAWCSNTTHSSLRSE
jgi:hypothetical protein